MAFFPMKFEIIVWIYAKRAKNHNESFQNFYTLYPPDELRYIQLKSNEIH